MPAVHSDSGRRRHGRKALNNTEEKKSKGDDADRFATSSRKAGPTIFEGHGVAVGVNSGGGRGGPRPRASWAMALVVAQKH